MYVWTEIANVILEVTRFAISEFGRFDFPQQQFQTFFPLASGAGAAQAARAAQRIYPQCIRASRARGCLEPAAVFGNARRLALMGKEKNEKTAELYFFRFRFLDSAGSGAAGWLLCRIHLFI